MSDLFGLSSATLAGPSDCWRYRLTRTFGDGPTVSWGLVNPSTADEVSDDLTVTKIGGFSRRFGYGRVILWNLFAWRATDVRELRDADDPVGPDNDMFIRLALSEADAHVVAWGSPQKLPLPLRRRWRDVVTIGNGLGVRFKCLGTTGDGHPLHPARIGYDRDLVDWSPP